MSSEPDRIKDPSLENDTHLTGAEWLLITYECPSTVFCHILIVSSAEQDAIRLPRGLILISYTGPLCPINLKGLNDGLKFQTITVPSNEDDTTYFKLGLKETDEIASLWPLNDLFKAGSPTLAKNFGYC